jgi:hypothetical protein
MRKQSWGTFSGMRWQAPPGGIPQREDEALSKRLVVLYHLWLYLHDAAGGRLKASALPAGTAKLPGRQAAFREAADVLQYHIQDYPEVSAKQQIVSEMFGGRRR